MKVSATTQPRSGAVAPLVAIMMIAIMAMVAFVVDVGWMILVQSELQNAADAAAIAGAAQLGDPIITWDQDAYSLTTPQNVTNLQALIYDGTVSTQPTTNSQVGNAQYAALDVSSQNRAANAAISLATSDIKVGYTTGSSFTDYSAGTNLPNSTTNIPWANTVQVTVRRDGTNGSNKLNLFFAQLIGTKDQALAAFAEARVTISNSVSSFNAPSGGANGTLLPVAVKKQDWDNFINNGLLSQGDNFGYSGSSGADGVNEFQIYPTQAIAQDASGNVGDLALTNGNIPNDNGDLQRWIRYGPNPSDLQSFGVNGLTPGSTLSGEPGLRSVLQTDYAAIVGQNRIIPLYDTIGGGNGNNATYHIIGFAAVTVVSSTGRGGNFQVLVQPTTTYDPTANFNNSGSGSPNSYNVASRVQLTK